MTEHLSRVSEVLIEHTRVSIERCHCGWSDLGRSHAEHVAQALDAAGRLASPDQPSVEIESRLGQPDTCVVTRRGVIVFDGVSREALIRTKSATEHDAAFAARALRDAATDAAYGIDWDDVPESVESWLHERADRIERGAGESGE